MPSTWTTERRDSLADKFSACDPEVLEWAEGFAVSAVKEQVDVGQVIAQQMSGTLTWLLGAAFGAAAYSSSVWEAPGTATPTMWAVLVAGAYLLLLCGVIVIEGMNFRPAPSAYNLPSNLVHPGSDLKQHRPGELVALEQRTDELRALNFERSKLLNRVRMAAVFAPLVLLLARLVISAAGQ